MALGCDQKKPSMKPWRAPISQSAMMPNRMPICAAMIAQSGQSFCTGRRRAGFGAACALAVSARRGAFCSGRVLDGHQAASSAGACAASSVRQRSLMAMNSGVSALVRARGRGSVIGMVSRMRPGRVPMTWISSDR